MLEIKKSWGIAAVWGIAIGGVGFLFYRERITWEVATALLVTLGLPSFLGAKGTKS